MEPKKVKQTRYKRFMKRVATIVVILYILIWFLVGFTGCAKEENTSITIHQSVWATENTNIDIGRGYAVKSIDKTDDGDNIKVEMIFEKDR